MACASSFDPDDRLEPVRPSYQPRHTPPPFIEPDPSDDKSSPRDRKASCYNNFRDYCLLYSGLAREDALYADRLDRPTDLSTRSAPPPPPPVQPAASTVCSAASFLDLPSASAAATSSSRALPAHHHPQQWPRPSLSCPSSTMLADAPPPDPPRGSSLDKYRLRPSPSLNTSLPSLQPATAPMSASLSAPVSALTPQSGRMLPSFRAAFPESPEPAPPRPLDPPLQLQSLSVSSPPPSSTRAYPVEPSFPHYHSPQGSHVSLPSIVPSPAYLPPVKTEYPVYPYAVRDHPIEYRPRPTDYSHYSQEALPLTSPIDKASPPRKSHRTATGAYKCPHPGCKAEPFQTQYLLKYACSPLPQTFRRSLLFLTGPVLMQTSTPTNDPTTVPSRTASMPRAARASSARTK